ncbi:MAG: transmembrane permease [Flavobacteriaceae bacterium]|nr:transmembrane permease [Flavobacteriaceae bacterium]
MNFPLFIAKRMRFNPSHKGSVSVQIIKIAKLAVALGMSMILIAVATGKGLQKEIQEKTVAFNGHLVVAPFENSESQISVLPVANDPKTLKILNKEDGVTHVNGVALKGGLLKAGDNFEGIIMKGVSQDYQWNKLNSFLVSGNFPVLGDKTSNEILLSGVIAKRLSIGVGDEVTAYFQNSKNQQLPNIRKFNVAGLFLSGFPEFDQNFVLGDLRHIQRINKWRNNEIGAYEVFVSNLKMADIIGSSIYDKLPSDLDVIEITRQYATIFQWISLFDFNILIIIIVMIIVGVINISTALLVLILERSSMIGLLKSIGAGNRLIQKIFLYNGVAIMSEGLLWGNLIGFLFYFTQNYWGWIRLDPETYYVNVAPVSLNFWDGLILNLGFLLVSSLLLWIPSLIISNIRPARVLRFR